MLRSLPGNLHVLQLPLFFWLFFLVLFLAPFWQSSLSQYCEVWTLEKASLFDVFLCGRNRLRFGPPLSLLVRVVALSFVLSFVRHAVFVFHSRYNSRRRPKALICLFGRNRERRCSGSAFVLQRSWRKLSWKPV